MVFLTLELDISRVQCQLSQQPPDLLARIVLFRNSVLSTPPPVAPNLADMHWQPTICQALYLMHKM